METESKYQEIFRKNPVSMWINDFEDFRMLEVNEAALQKYGYDKAAFLDLSLPDIQLPEDNVVLLKVITSSNFKESGMMHTGLFRHTDSKGDKLIVELTCYAMPHLGKPAVLMQVIDMTDKLRLEKELLLQQQLRELEITEAILSAQERQSKIIGDELENNISQILATVKLCLHEALNEHEPRVELISRSHKNISRAIIEIRTLSKLLVAPNLENRGLLASIKELIQNIRLIRKLKIKLIDTGLVESNLNQRQKEAIYRILQEQLKNIIKYAGASCVRIGIIKEGDTVSLVIADDGKGFDPAARRNGIGFKNILAMARLLNGEMDIISSPGQGCTLNVIFHSGTDTARYQVPLLTAVKRNY